MSGGNLILENQNESCRELEGWRHRRGRVRAVGDFGFVHTGNGPCYTYE